MRHMRASTCAGRRRRPAPAVHGVRARAGVRTAAAGPARLRELRRHAARRARCTAPAAGRSRRVVRPVRAGDVEAGGRLVADGGRAPQRRRVPLARPLHHREQSRRQRRCALRRDFAGARRRAGRASSRWHLYASYGHGFETPTFNELGYRADGGSGLNFELDAARTRSAEAGVRYRDASASNRSSCCSAPTRATNSPSTPAAAAAPRSRMRAMRAARARNGRARVRFASRLALHVRGHVGRCPLPRRFPGLPHHALPSPDTPVACGHAHSRRPANHDLLGVAVGRRVGWHARVDGQYVGAVPVNNLDDERAAAYAVFGASAGYGVRDGMAKAACSSPSAICSIGATPAR